MAGWACGPRIDVDATIRGHQNRAGVDGRGWVEENTPDIVMGPGCTRERSLPVHTCGPAARRPAWIRRRRCGACPAEQAHVPKPQIVGVTGAIVDSNEWNTSLWRRVVIDLLPCLPAIGCFVDRETDHGKQDMGFVWGRRDGTASFGQLGGPRRPGP